MRKIAIVTWEVIYHWQGLPQVVVVFHNKGFVVPNTFLLPQTHCVATKRVFCHGKVCLSWQKFFSQQKVCFVMTNTCLSWQTCVCRDETFVTTKMILVAAPANDSSWCEGTVLTGTWLFVIRWRHQKQRKMPCRRKWKTSPPGSRTSVSMLQTWRRKMWATFTKLFIISRASF